MSLVSFVTRAFCYCLVSTASQLQWFLAVSGFSSSIRDGKHPPQSPYLDHHQTTQQASSLNQHILTTRYIQIQLSNANFKPDHQSNSDEQNNNKMCRQLEILIVCCSIECFQDENNLRLPLLRLIPAPAPLHLLCEQGTALGYRADGHLFEIPVFSGTPNLCPEYRQAAAAGQTHEVCFSGQASRETMAKAANVRVRCAACARGPRADMIPIANSGPNVASTRRRGARAIARGTRRIQSAWTCCATRECQGEDGTGGLCKFRAAALLSAFEGREAHVAQLRAIAAAALAARQLVDMANGRSAEEQCDDEESTIMVAGDCPGCDKCIFEGRH